jgi:hypothetical protein
MAHEWWLRTASVLSLRSHMMGAAASSSPPSTATVAPRRALAGARCSHHGVR